MVETQTQPNVTAIVIQLGKRLQLMDDRIDSLRDHLEVLDNNLKDKDMGQTEQINSIWETLKEMKAELKESTETFQKIADKLDIFATKDQFKVLERYINMWDPLDAVTRREVEDLIDEKLKEKDK